METFIKAFIRASLVWLTAGILFGLAIAFNPDWVIYRPAHAHMNVVGFLTLFVFGVGYQLLPRLFGHPLYSRRLAVAHLYLANVGLAGLVLGFVVRPHAGPQGRWLIAAGGTLFAVGALSWVWNMWRTFGLAEALRRKRAQSRATGLPTLED